MENHLVHIPDGSVILSGALAIPDHPKGIVLFAHGSGSSRLSPRNNYVAETLRDRGMGTLLMDLLTPEEDVHYATRFDIALLAHRLEVATLWLQQQEDTKSLPIAYFGASTGAAAAIQTAATLGGEVKAIVSRGGRPDMAWDYLATIMAPTLLIVGGADGEVINLNRKAFDRISTIKELAIIPNATHLFEEPGTLEKVAALAGDWFAKYFGIK